MLKLKVLEDQDEQTFMSALEEWQQDDLSYYCTHWQPGMTFKDLVVALQDIRLGKNLPQDFVPATTFYAFDDSKIVGRLTLRHQLTEKLMKYGGHIGYGVNPSQRNKGYASQMLKLALHEAAELGLEKVLLTCDHTNIGSIKVIEKNNGQLYETGKNRRSYWIITK